MDFPKHFGLIIAYLLPGFVALVGLAPVVPSVSVWLLGESGIGRPIYAILAATTMGMVVSCFRWLIVDHLLRWTGVPKASGDYANLDGNMDAVHHLIASHYQFYQFYANTFVAIVWSYLLNRCMGTLPFLGLGTDLGVLILCAGLFAGSRDTLLKYRTRREQVLRQSAEKG